MRSPRPIEHLHARLGKWGWTAAAVLLLLRLAWLRGLPVNSDEPQHLHVVWAWTQGLLPYRDVFDNHTPLFHFLFAPVLMLVGESSGVLTWMRLAMVPLGLAILWCTWRIGVALWGRRTGLWAAALTALFPTFFLLSGQFRTDVLWAAAWLAAWAAALAGRWTNWRAFATGVLVGAAFSVSLKTSLLMAGAALGFVIWLLARARRVTREDVVACLAPSGIFLLGVAVLPAIIAIFFAANGALDDLWYGIVQHNLVPGLGRVAHEKQRLLLLPVALLVAYWLARRSLRHARDARASLRALLLLCGAGYAILLYTFWPLITRQDLLPVQPLAALGLVALLTMRRTRSRWPGRVLALALVLEFCVLLVQMPPWRHPDVAFRDELRTLLALTRDDDYVMDAKGSTIFRQRPWYYALEGITDTRLRLGLIVDDLPQRLAQTDTKVLVFDRLKGTDLDYAKANYLLVHGRIGVAGKQFEGLKAGQRVNFTLDIAARYTVVSRDGSIGDVRLDGTRYVLPLALAAGAHTLVVKDPGDYALVWSTAVDQGYSPYAEPDEER